MQVRTSFQCWCNFPGCFMDSDVHRVVRRPQCSAFRGALHSAFHSAWHGAWHSAWHSAWQSSSHSAFTSSSHNSPQVRRINHVTGTGFNNGEDLQVCA